MKKEIMIDGTASDWFEKAIFILKEEDMSKLPNDLMSYAEEIVEQCMKKRSGIDPKLIAKAQRAYETQGKYKSKDKDNVAKIQGGVKLQLNEVNTLQMEYEKLKQMKAALKKRERYVNRFVALSLLAAILSIAALAFSCTV